MVVNRGTIRITKFAKSNRRSLLVSFFSLHFLSFCLSSYLLFPPFSCKCLLHCVPYAEPYCLHKQCLFPCIFHPDQFANTAALFHNTPLSQTVGTEYETGRFRQRLADPDCGTVRIGSRTKTQTHKAFGKKRRKRRQRRDEKRF